MSMAYLVAVRLPTAAASSILGFAMVGTASHQLNMLTLGRELVNRGQEFSLLLSSAETLSREIIKAKSFPGLQVLEFDGPPGIGTKEWAATLPLDPKEVAHHVQ